MADVAPKSNISYGEAITLLHGLSTYRMALDKIEQLLAKANEASGEIASLEIHVTEAREKFVSLTETYKTDAAKAKVAADLIQSGVRQAESDAKTKLAEINAAVGEANARAQRAAVDADAAEKNAMMRRQAAEMEFASVRASLMSEIADLTKKRDNVQIELSAVFARMDKLRS